MKQFFFFLSMLFCISSATFITQGPVVVSTGSTTIKASQGTTITKDFQVDLGAEFAITNE